MIWSDDDRLIYQPDGTGLKFDPLRVRNQLTVKFGGLAELNKIQDARRSGDEVRVASAELVAADHARAAFNLKATDTDEMALALLDDFLGWLEKKGSTGVSSPTSPCADCPSQS